jgi:hypothetical protein
MIVVHGAYLFMFTCFLEVSDLKLIIYDFNFSSMLFIEYLYIVTLLLWFGSVKIGYYTIVIV